MLLGVGLDFLSGVFTLRVFAAINAYLFPQRKPSASNQSICRYRDFGDKRRYEGPYDFCGEDELPGLLAKLRNIRAYGGKPGTVVCFTALL